MAVPVDTTTTPLLSDVINYVRRIIKQPNPEDISDATISDFFNRFYVYDMPSRIQLFDLRTQYSLELIPFVDQYNAPVTYLPSGGVVPTYNSFILPAYCDGYQIVMQQSNDQWFKLFPNRVFNQYQQNGVGSTGPYTLFLYQPPVVQGHRDQNIQPFQSVSAAITNITQASQAVVTSINNFVPGQFVLIAGVVGMTQLNGNTYQVVNSTGTQFTLNVDSTGFSAYVSGGTATIPSGTNNSGLLTSNVYVTAIDVNGNLNVAQDDPLSATTGNLIQYDPLNPGNAPTIVGSINYQTGAISVTFLNTIPTTSAINSQSIPYAAGRPQAVKFYNNTFSFRPIPDKPYVFQIDAYYNPAAFISTTNAIPYRWMAEYFARGTARKILQDYGDIEQLQLYEPFFKEQENFVLRRTYRQNSNVRTATIYQAQTGFNQGSSNSI